MGTPFAEVTLNIVRGAMENGRFEDVFLYFPIINGDFVRFDSYFPIITRDFPLLC